KDDTVTFETGADRTKLTVKKWAIQTRTSPAQEVKEEPAKVEETPAEAAEAETPKKKKFFGK
ncbi:MAG: hypothetical protein IKT81_04035, partial [Clostridia bacterium]|nr:hypothetical protein [Clostridia bacterium]